MSWQEQLQQLDAALAAGQISADEYRTRRDQLLAQASGQAAAPQQPAQPQQQAPQQPQQPPGQQPPGQPGPHQTGPQPAQQPPQQSSPFPPAFKWQTEKPQIPEHQEGNAEATAIVPVIRDEPPQGAPERTQIVSPVGPGPRPGGGNGGGHDSDSDTTQVVSSERTQAVNPENTQIVRNQQPTFPPAPAQSPWGSPQQQPPQADLGRSATPWGSDELPPDFGQNSWPRQGPEIFEEKSSGKGKGKLVAIIAVVVLVLAGGGAALWFLVRNKPDTTTTQPGPSTPVSTKPSPPPGPKLARGPFVELPGKPLTEPGGQNVPIAQAVTAKIPSEQEAQKLQQNGVTEIGAYVTEEDDLKRGIWTFTPAEGADPATLLKLVDQQFADEGYQVIPNLATGISGRHLPISNINPGSIYRAQFITQGVVVRVEAYGPDDETAKDAFTELLKQVTAKYPPTT